MVFDFGSGFIPAFIFGLTLLEAAALWALHRTGLSPVSLSKIIPTILAGDGLLLAWLAAQRHAPWPVTAACLLLALVAHGVDIAGRFKN